MSPAFSNFYKKDTSSRLKDADLVVQAQENQEIQKENLKEEKEITNQSKLLKEEVKDTSLEIQNHVFELINYFTTNNEKLLKQINTSTSASKDLKDTILDEAAAQLRKRKVKEEKIPQVLDLFEKRLWGYYIVDPLINDPDISDIKILSYKNIRIKKLGKRMTSSIRFSDKKEYDSFVKLVAVKNKTNLSVINAIQNFTDKSSNQDFTLRFNISTDFVNTHGSHYVHIRKIAKNKPLVDDLLRDPHNMLTEAQASYLRDKAKNAQGIIFTGKGASGKTTLINALLEEIPHDKSGLVIQENEELFSKQHPDMMFQHVVTTRGEGSIGYNLDVLARNGLLTDLDYFVIGEIKGNEAKDFMMAAYTGHKCWSSVHGMNSTEAINKLADYVKQATHYEFNECLKMLSGIQVVVFLENYKVKEISEINGYDYENNSLKIKKLDI